MPHIVYKLSPNHHLKTLIVLMTTLPLSFFRTSTGDSYLMPKGLDQLYSGWSKRYDEMFDINIVHRL
jgi:hypothetical protein